MPSTSSTLGLRRPTSPAAIFTLFHSTIVIIGSSLSLYNPFSLQQQLSIPDATSARFISFCLIAIKAYEVIGALQDNHAIYTVAIVGRTAAASLMMAAGGGWAKIAPLDFGSAVVLGACMMFSSTGRLKRE